MAKKQTAAERGAALQALKAALKSGGLSNFYVFYGEESFLKERYWQMLEKKGALRVRVCRLRDVLLCGRDTLD